MQEAEGAQGALGGHGFRKAGLGSPRKAARAWVACSASPCLSLSSCKMEMKTPSRL